MRRAFFRGHPILFEGEYPKGRWVYADTREPLPAAGGKIRACATCGSKHALHESDPCLGNLPGVDNACCGHGIREESYIRFTTGVTIMGFVIETPAKGTKP